MTRLLEKYWVEFVVLCMIAAAVCASRRVLRCDAVEQEFVNTMVAIRAVAQ